MLKLRALTVLLVGLFSVTRGFELGPGPSEAFYQLEILSEPNDFILYWKVVDHTHIVIEIHAKIHGWLAFGSDSEVVVAWVANPDGTGHFSNRVLNTNDSTLGAAVKKPWRVLDLHFKNAYTILKMMRKVCDLNWNNTVVFGMGKRFHNGDISEYKDELVTAEMDLLDGYRPVEPCLPKVATAGNKKQLKLSSVDYVSSSELVDGFLYFYWNHTETKFTGEIHVKLKSGWIMLGFETFDVQQTAIQSDVFVAWIDAVKANLIVSVIFVHSEVFFIIHFICVFPAYILIFQPIPLLIPLPILF